MTDECGVWACGGVLKRGLKMNIFCYFNADFIRFYFALVYVLRGASPTGPSGKGDK